ncbi:MAG: hypothetical protein HQL02_07535 [Nitrospirae bacterium]|nr:hypothetical protein [Nitrospirota bacterium]
MEANRKVNYFRSWFKGGRSLLATLTAAMFLAIFFYVPLAHSDELTRSEHVKNAIINSGAQWEANDTKESRLSEALQQSKLGFIPPSHIDENHIKGTEGYQSEAALPASLDWRDNNGNYVTPVKDQGYCASCWAFATTAALESATMIANDTPLSDLDLSEQVTLSCTSADSGFDNCNGGSISDASYFLMSIGSPVEACYPYTATYGSCSQACSDRLTSSYKENSWTWVATPNNISVSNLKNALNTYGPIIASVIVYQDFYYYVSGVYSYVAGKSVGYHAVLLIGYDDSGSYFIAKNSWGTDWGESGYFRIAYSEVGGPTRLGQYSIGYTVAGQKQLTVSNNGTGSGTVTPSIGTLTWNGNTGTGNYKTTDTVTLTATADSNSSFAGWTDCPTVVNNTQCTLSMSTSKTVTATFNLNPPTLTVSNAGAGSGTVVSSPAGISCSGSTTCATQFPYNSSVTLTATADSNSSFAGWTGCTGSSGNTCSVSMAASTSVTAIFNANPLVLTVSNAGKGSGTVVSSPVGISCSGSSNCAMQFPYNSNVTLTATPDSISNFASWTGCTTSSGNTCNVTMTAAQSVTATFSTKTFPLTLSVIGTGKGTVKSSPLGVSCSVKLCPPLIYPTNNFTLTATPSSGYSFVGWTGCTSSSGNICNVSMTAATLVTATFQ